MVLNVNRYANVFLECSLRANEGRIGVNEYINHNETNLDTNEWIFSGNEQQKVYCKTTDENIRDSKTTRLMPREILAHRGITTGSKTGDTRESDVRGDFSDYSFLFSILVHLVRTQLATCCKLQN